MRDALKLFHTTITPILSRSSVYLTTDSALSGCSALVALPLLGSLALCRPGVDGCDFGLESRVDESVALEGVEALELRGDDDGGESLAAAAWMGLVNAV